MIWLGGFGRLCASAALAVGLGVTLPASAQDSKAPPAQNNSSDKLDALKQRDEELKAARDQQRKSAETEAALRRDIDQIGADRRKFNQDLIDTAARLRDVESKITATQDRLKLLDDTETRIHKSLESRRELISEVLAALQRIGRRAPPALIASPEDALQSVRTAMVLGAVLPQMRHELSVLANELSDLIAVRKKIDTEREQLRTEVASLGREQLRMTLLVDERQRQLAEREKALDAERTRAGGLARDVDNLKDLIAKLEQSLDQAAIRQPARAVRLSRPRTPGASRRLRFLAWTSSKSG